MDWSERRNRFRAVLEGEACVSPASVFDPLSARIAEEIGFEIGMLAGSVGALTVLGSPDLILLTATEFAEQAYRINRACALPLMVDADHGYGNALNVMNTVSELETAGVSGLSIEDTALPRPYGAAKAALIPLEEAVGKLRAAVAGRSDPRLVIAGRTDVSLAGGLDAAVARTKAYSQTGVDALFFTRIKTREELEAVAGATRLPIILGGGPADLKDPALLARLGVRIALRNNKPVLAAAQAVYDILKAQREGSPEPATLADDHVARLTRADEYKAAQKSFLGL